MDAITYFLLKSVKFFTEKCVIKNPNSFTINEEKYWKYESNGTTNNNNNLIFRTNSE